MWSQVWRSLGWEWICLHSIPNDPLCPMPNKIWVAVQWSSLNHPLHHWTLLWSSKMEVSYPPLRDQNGPRLGLYSTIIVACIVLQSIAIHLREPELDDGLIGDEEYHLHEQYRGPENGNALRSHIIDTFFWRNFVSLGVYFCKLRGL